MNFSSVAFTVARFVVDPHQPEASTFNSEGEAREVARMAVKRVGTVRVFRVLGEPVTGLWDQPQLVASYGEVPGVG